MDYHGGEGGKRRAVAAMVEIGGDWWRSVPRTVRSNATVGALQGSDGC